MYQMNLNEDPIETSGILKLEELVYHYEEENTVEKSMKQTFKKNKAEKPKRTKPTANEITIIW